MPRHVGAIVASRVLHLHILFFAYLLFRCYFYHHYKIPKTLLLLPLPLLSYYFATKYFAADIKFPCVVELTTQLLILENILWLPLCRINKFGLNTLPSKTVAIPYTCGLSCLCYNHYKTNTVTFTTITFIIILLCY